MGGWGGAATHSHERKATSSGACPVAGTPLQPAHASVMPLAMMGMAHTSPVLSRTANIHTVNQLNVPASCARSASRKSKVRSRVLPQ